MRICSPVPNATATEWRMTRPMPRKLATIKEKIATQTISDFVPESLTDSAPGASPSSSRVRRRVYVFCDPSARSAFAHCWPERVGERPIAPLEGTRSVRTAREAA